MNGLFDNLVAGDFASDAGNTEVVLLALLVALCIGHVIAWVYMWTHDGLSYSRTFTASLLAIPVIVALMMLLMAGSILIAFGLLAVFAVVRFRNVLKDTRDTTFILWAIVEGMAAGTMRLELSILGAVVVAIVFLYIWATAFGKRHRYDVEVAFQTDADGPEVDAVRRILRRHAGRVRLAGRRELDDDRRDMSYFLLLRDPARARELIAELNSVAGIDHVELFRREDESEI